MNSMSLSVTPKFLQSIDLIPENVFTKSGLLIVQEKGENQESHIDGGFVLYLLLSEFYGHQQRLGIPKELDYGRHSCEKKTLLILNHQTEKHWSICSAKLGQNLETLKKSGNLIVIDTLKENCERLLQKHCSVNEVPKAKQPEDVQRITNEFGDLLTRCKSCIDALCPDGLISSSTNTTQVSTSRPKLLIIIENLTSLMYAKNANVNSSRSSNSDTDSFIKSALEFLRQLRTYRSTALDLCIATLVKSSHCRDDINNVNYMVNVMTDCLENTTFQVSPLATGYSEAVNGKLIVKARQGPRKSYQYKIEDRNVKFLSINS